MSEHTPGSTPPPGVDVVRHYYNENAEHEWLRLETDRIEFAITTARARRVPAGAAATVLDIGGGPGRYAIELARRGYDVTLADFSSSELAIARERADEAGVALEIVECDARDLSRFADGSFDAVLMMGPLYHLLDAADRAKAIAEAKRVLAPGGRYFAAYIVRTAVLRFWAKYDPGRIADDRARYEEHLRTGEVRDNFGFTDVYLAHPTEITPVMEQAGFAHARPHRLRGRDQHDPREGQRADGRSMGDVDRPELPAGEGSLEPRRRRAPALHRRKT